MANDVLKLLPIVSMVTVVVNGAIHFHQSVAPNGTNAAGTKSLRSPLSRVAPVLFAITCDGVLRVKRFTKLLFASGSVTNVTVLTADVLRRPRLSVATAVKSCAPAVGPDSLGRRS